MMDPGNDEEDSEVVLGKLCSEVHAKLWLLSFCVFPWTSFLFFFDVEWYLNHVFEVTQTLRPHPLLPSHSMIGVVLSELMYYTKWRIHSESIVEFTKFTIAREATASKVAPAMLLLFTFNIERIISK